MSEPKAAAPSSKKARLGKGLSALMGEYLTGAETEGASGLRMLPTARVAPNPFQPRREFAEEQLSELEGSIRQNGLLQPIVVRAASPAAPEGAEWELVAGERRWRAVRRLGWTEIPAVVKELDDRTMLILAIVENVQRAELSPLEEARGYRQLIDDFGFTQATVAESVGRERSTIANLLRLLHLPASVQRLVSEGQITMGHARALLGLEDARVMADLAREAAEAGLSVRLVEQRVRARRVAPEAPAAQSGMPAARDPLDDPHLRRLETELQRALGTGARIRLRAGKAGRIEIPFHNADDFDRVLELILGGESQRS